MANSGYRSGDRITISVPYAAGGGFDIYTRTLQPYLETALKQVTGQDVSVLVQNVTGANGQLAVEQVYRAPADGKQLVILGVDIAVSQQVVHGANFDLAKMGALAQINDVPRSLMIRPGVISPNGDFGELVQRSHQKAVLWGGSGSSEIDKLTFALLKDGGTDIAADTVEFQGTSEAIASMLRGELEVYNVTLPTAVTQAKANPSLRVLVSFGGTRIPEAPDVPTLKEMGVGGADEIAQTTGTSVRVFMTPPGLQSGTLSALQEAFRVAENNPDFVARSNSLGNPVTYATADDIRSRIDANVRFYTKYLDLLKS